MKNLRKLIQEEVQKHLGLVEENKYDLSYLRRIRLDDLSLSELEDIIHYYMEKDFDDEFYASKEFEKIYSILRDIDLRIKQMITGIRSLNSKKG